MNDYINNYIDRFYNKYLNKSIYVHYNYDIIECCKFISHKSHININDKMVKCLLLRSPQKIKIKLENNNKVILHKNDYKYVYSKDLLDIYDEIIIKNKLPFEIKRNINSYIPEFGKLF